MFSKHTNFYTNLWFTPKFQLKFLETENADDYCITNDELRVALRKTKHVKSPGEDNLNSELYKYAGVLFNDRFLRFLNKIYQTTTLPEEWKTSIII